MASRKRRFKDAIYQSYQEHGRARTVQQGADLAWKAAKPLFDELEAQRFALATIIQQAKITALASDQGDSFKPIYDILDEADLDATPEQD